MDKNNYHISSVVQSYLEELDYRCQNRGKPLGLSTGIKTLDKRMEWMRNGEVILFSARPAMGKTSFAVNCSYQLAKTFLETPQNRNCVLYFSLEYSRDILLPRFISHETKQPSREARYQRYSDVCFEKTYEDFEEIINATKRISELPLYICDYLNDMYEMENIVQQVNQQKHVAFIVVDFFQAFPLSGNSEAMKEIKRLAQTFNVPILVLSQLNRNLERRKDKRPYLNDIRGGDKKILPYVDKILFLYREYYYLWWNEPEIKSGETQEHFEKRQGEWEKQCKDIENECEIILAKGKYGCIKCFFDIDTGIFDDLDPLEDDVPF